MGPASSINRFQLTLLLVFASIWMLTGCVEPSGSPATDKTSDESAVITECPTPALNDSYPQQISAVSSKYQSCLLEKAKKVLETRFSGSVTEACIDVNDWGEIQEISRCQYIGEATFSPDDETDASELALESLEKLRGQIGIPDDVELTIVHTWHSSQIQTEPCESDCVPKIRTFNFEFRTQYHAGLEVLGSDLSIWVSRYGVDQIDSSWRSDISVETRPKIPEIAGRGYLVGKTLYYEGFDGSRLSDFVSPESVEQGDLVILRDGYGDALSYSLVWRYPINGGLWTGYVDAITGSILGFTQNFET